MGSNGAIVGYDEYCIGGVAKRGHLRKPRTADEPAAKWLWRRWCVLKPLKCCCSRITWVAALAEAAGALEVESLEVAGDVELDEVIPA